MGIHEAMSTIGSINAVITPIFLSEGGFALFANRPQKQKSKEEVVRRIRFLVTWYKWLLKTMEYRNGWIGEEIDTFEKKNPEDFDISLIVGLTKWIDQSKRRELAETLKPAHELAIEIISFYEKNNDLPPLTPEKEEAAKEAKSTLLYLDRELQRKTAVAKRDAEWIISPSKPPSPVF